MSPPPSEELGQSGCYTSFEDLLAGFSCKFVLALVIIFLVCFLSFWSFRSGSWAEPNSNRRPTQTIWTGWIDSDVAWFSDVRGRWRSLSRPFASEGSERDRERPRTSDDQANNSDADLNSSRTKFKRRKMLISVKLLTKYVIIIANEPSERRRSDAEAAAE